MHMCVVLLILYSIYMQIKSDQTLTNDGKDTKMFPDSSSTHSRITCHALCSDFLVYGNDVSQHRFEIIYLLNSNN